VQLAQLADLITAISTAVATASCPMNNGNDPMVESSIGTLNVPAVNSGEAKGFSLSDFPGA
jgi:hypothetical protein